ncbi:uncharacterized protein RJT21DRAFT_13659 [Scheffersomyces amazonensis]|uniref:uncharacterized protein n=1 Tax=Scheffersomyces amazonensis TaxID=1078765 RepID=UPI00315D8B34
MAQMFRIYTHLIWVVFFWLNIVNGLEAVAFTPHVNDYDINGASCGLVKKISGSKDPAFIHAYVDNLYTTDESLIPTLKFPIIIFKYTDIANFTNLPTFTKYDSLYKEDKAELYKDLVDFETNKFKLDLAKDAQFNEADIYNDYITLDNKDDSEHIDVIFPVERSGFYCVYIAPPTDQSLTSVTIPVTFKNSYGNLGFTYYLENTQRIYVIIIACVFFGYLLNYILQFKVDDDFKNLNSVSLISRVLVFFVVLPYIFLNIYLWFIFFLLNRISESYLLNVLANFGIALGSTFQVVLNYFTLLFAMGYGVIYYHNGNSKNYRMMPQKSLSHASYLLIANLVLLIAFIFLDINAVKANPFVNNRTDVENSKFVTRAHSALGFILSIISFLWLILSIVNYFKTKKIISKFPTGTNDKLITAFRRSILVIFVLPVFIFFLSVGVLIYKLLHNIKLPTQGVSDLEMEVFQIKIMETSLLESSGLLFVIWSEKLTFFLTIGLMYAIWVKDNTGVIYDPNANDPIEYADVSQYEISDEEDLVGDNEEEVRA